MGKGVERDRRPTQNELDRLMAAFESNERQQSLSDVKAPSPAAEPIKRAEAEPASSFPLAERPVMEALASTRSNKIRRAHPVGDSGEDRSQALQLLTPQPHYHQV